MTASSLSTGNASGALKNGIGSLSFATFTPTSIIIRDSLVVTKWHALPTSLYDPNAVTLAHMEPGLFGRWMFKPKFFSNLRLSSAFTCR